MDTQGRNPFICFCDAQKAFTCSFTHSFIHSHYSWTSVGPRNRETSKARSMLLLHSVARASEVPADVPGDIRVCHLISGTAQGLERMRSLAH